MAKMIAGHLYRLSFEDINFNGSKDMVCLCTRKMYGGYQTVDLSLPEGYCLIDIDDGGLWANHIQDYDASYLDVTEELRNELKV